MDQRQFDLTYLSLGAGVQSSALLVCSALGLHGVPRADVAIFADTKNEPPHVYDAVARLTAWAAPHGIAVETVTAGDLLADAMACMAGSRTRYSNIPTWVRGADGREAPGRRQCTKDYKIVPIERRVRELLGYKPRQRVRKQARALIGISIDEFTRMKTSRTRWVTNDYPLVNAMLSRDGCSRIVVSAGLPLPRKSACVFCPYTDNARWKEMRRDDPASFDRACAADEALRNQEPAGLKEPAFVHRSLVPLRAIDFDSIPDAPVGVSQPTLGDSFTNECDGMCGV